MNKVMKLLGGVGLASLISGQIYYFTQIYPSYQEAMGQLDQTILRQENTLKTFEEGLKRLPQSKAELETLQLEVVSLIQRMPSYSMVSKDLSNMTRMLEGNQFINIKMDSGETLTHEYEGYTFLERQYTLRYIAPFSESKAFVEGLGESYQLINISQFTTDNSPQVDGESKAAYQLMYGEKFKELVETTLTFSLFINPNFEQSEVYDPSMNVLVDPENAFRNLEESLGQEEVLREPLHIPARPQETYFELILRAEETQVCYEFNSTWQGKEPLAMTSEEKMNVYITLDEAAYQVVLRDSRGREVKKEVVEEVKAPTLKIMTEKEGGIIFPEVNIYIENYTKEVVVVDIAGKMLGNLHIYNEKAEEVHRGGIKGKVVVR